MGSSGNAATGSSDDGDMGSSAASTGGSSISSIAEVGSSCGDSDATAAMTARMTAEVSERRQAAAAAWRPLQEQRHRGNGQRRFTKMGSNGDGQPWTAANNGLQRWKTVGDGGRRQTTADCGRRRWKETDDGGR